MAENGDGTPPPDEVLKADRNGRLRMSRERQEALLDEFERSGVSGVQFTAAHGINYQTFLGWRKRRRRQGKKRRSIGTAPTPAPKFELQEVVVGDSSGEDAAALEVEIPGGIRLRLSNREQVDLAADLIRRLQLREGPC